MKTGFVRPALLGCLLAAVPGSASAGGQPLLTAEAARNRMVDEEIAAAGVRNPRVIQAMRTTPRHEFVPLPHLQYAYYDMALPIGYSQTISPPFVVAYMTEQLDPQPTDKVLEIGTGSGYQAAILSGLVREVYTIEIVRPLGVRAMRTHRRLRYRNVHGKVGDGYEGWPEHAPFDKIIVTCSPEKVPQALVDQLKEGGRMVVPIGERYQQNLYLLRKTQGRLETEALRPTLFVPMTGEAEDRREVKPDPANPTVRNGDFEEIVKSTGQPAGWHYQRQLTLATGNAPSGDHYVTFTNADPGRGCRALQGLAVDGRRVQYLSVTLRVRGRNVRQGQDDQQLPQFVITFYDENRETLSDGMMGPWQGSFDWRTETARIAVPPRAREGIVRIGLLGGVGEVSIDNIVMERLDQP